MEQARQTLEAWLLDPDPRIIESASQTGQLGDILPEWQRLTSPWNIQHRTHHFPLDEHTLKVLAKAKASPYYQSLDTERKLLVTLSALLHDIDKITGPARLRDVMAVDKLHPIKSAEKSQEILTRLNYPPETIQRIYTLIHHHQIFGRLFIIYPDGAPPEALVPIAWKIRSPWLLPCLLALSEGDISSVQANDAFFIPPVPDQLAGYGEQVAEIMKSFQPKGQDFPQHIAFHPDGTLNKNTTTCFVLPADSEVALQSQLNDIAWGGAIILPYIQSRQAWDALEAQHIACIRFLPENLAYCGPAPEPGLPFGRHPMPLFHSLYTGLETFEASLSPAEKAFTAACRRHATTVNTETPQLGIGTRPILAASPLFLGNNRASQ